MYETSGNEFLKTQMSLETIVKNKNPKYEILVEGNIKVGMHRSKENELA